MKYSLTAPAGKPVVITAVREGHTFSKNLKTYPQVVLEKPDSITDYLHKVTRQIDSYCKDNNIHTVVMGDITNICKDNKLGSKTNQ